jgi:methionyl-tRNA formyltransferase
VAVVCTPPLRAKSATERLTRVFRYHGVPGVALLPFRKLRDLASGVARRLRPTTNAHGAPNTLRFDNFHSEACLAALRSLDLDVLVIDGTYLLRESVFSVPRRVTLNLHCGKLPEYRGAPPAFWEVYNGEPAVGVTIHAVTSGLDAGPIYNQKVFPLERCPGGPALQYVRDIWLNVLRPAGVELMALTLDQIADGTACPKAQDAIHTAYKRPDYKTARELQARIDARCRSS